MTSIPRRVWRRIVIILVGFDILVCAWIGGRAGETISHYANRHRDTWGGPVCAVLDVVDPGHCASVHYFAQPRPSPP